MKITKIVNKFLLVLILLSTSWAFSGIPDRPKAIVRADELFEMDKFEQSNKLLLSYVKANPDCIDSYWMIARNFYSIGNSIPIKESKKKKLEMYILCEEWAGKGYKKHPEIADNSFWMAAGQAMQGQTIGVARTILTRRKLAKQIEEGFVTATLAKEYRYVSTTVNTVSAGHLALGLFYKKLPESALMERITGTKGDLDKSVEHLRKGRDIFPNNHELAKELGVALICRGQRRKRPQDIEEGKKYLKIAIELPIVRPTNKVEIDDSKKILKDPSLACGYSRVQQEEVTSDKLK